MYFILCIAHIEPGVVYNMHCCGNRVQTQWRLKAQEQIMAPPNRWWKVTKYIDLSALFKYSSEVLYVYIPNTTIPLYLRGKCCTFTPLYLFERSLLLYKQVKTNLWWAYKSQSIVIGCGNKGLHLIGFT